MDLAEPAQAVTAAPHLGEAAGVVGELLRQAAADAEGHILHPQFLEDRLNGALHSVEVHVAAVGAQGQCLGLDGQAVLAAGQVRPAHLIELHVLIAVVVVPGQDLQHGGQGGGPHDGGILP